MLTVLLRCHKMQSVQRTAKDDGTIPPADAKSRLQRVQLGSSEYLLKGKGPDGLDGLDIVVGEGNHDEGAGNGETMRAKG